MPAPLKIEDEKDRELYDSMEATARCALCPGEPVVHKGTAAECREAAKQHRLEKHPEVKEPKRSQFGNKRACNVGACMNPSAVRQGRYAGMCAHHRDEAKRTDEADERRKRGSAAGGATRSERARSQTLITPPRMDAAWRIYQAGCTIRQIGHLAFSMWGYKNETACSHAIGVEFKRAGKQLRGDRGASREIPEIARQEALALIEETR